MAYFLKDGNVIEVSDPAINKSLVSGATQLSASNLNEAYKEAEKYKTGELKLPESPGVSLDTNSFSVEGLSTSTPAVNREDITKQVSEQFAPARTALAKSFEQRIQEAVGMSEQEKRALGGKLGTGRRFSSSAEAFIKFVDEENKKQIATLEVQRDEALANFDYKMAGLIEERIKDARSEQQQNFDNTLKLLTLAQSQSEKKTATPELRSKKDAFLVAALNEGYTDKGQILMIGRELFPDLTAEEVSESIKYLLPEGKDEKNIPADAQMFQWLKDNGQLDENATVFDFWKMEATAKKNADKVGNAAGTRGDIGEFMYMMSVLPARLKDSDSEKALLREYYDFSKTKGASVYSMVDELMGYRVDSPSAFSEGMRNAMLNQNLDQPETAAIGRLINNGQFEEAIQVVENAGYTRAKNQMGDTFISEAEVRYLVEKSNEINNTMEAYGFFDAIGPFAGTLQEAMGRLGSKKAKELKAKITFLTQEMQKRQAGSALTESEWQRILAPIVPQLTDKRDVFENKIKEGKNNAIQRLNSERRSVELPSINEDELFDRTLRIPAYSSFSSVDPLKLNSGGGVTEDNPLGLDL